MVNSGRIAFVISGFLFCFVLTPGKVSAVWPAFQANYQRNGQTGGKGPLNPVIKWRFAGLGDYAAAVVGADETVYAAGKDVFYAVAPDGKEKWRYSYPDGYFGIPSMAPDGVVYVTVEKKKKVHLLAFDPLSGKVKWNVLATPQEETGFFEYWISQIAVASDGTIYVVCVNTITAFNPAGVKKWSYEFPSSDTDSVAPSLSPDESVIYVYRSRGGLHAFDKHGKLKWSDKKPYYTAYSSPSVAPDGTVYLLDGGAANNLHAISPEGEEKWKVHFEGKDLNTANVAIGKDGTVYVDAAGGSGKEGATIYAVDPRNGKKKWGFKLDSGRAGAAAVVDGRGNIYYASYKGDVYCIKPDGTLAWKYSTGAENRFYYTSPSISGETLYAITSRNGILFAIGTDSAK